MRTPADLRKTFLAIDHIFFGGQLVRDKVKCRWKRFRPMKNHILWGQIILEDREIQINYRLAHPDVPDYVVAAVLFHECLHHIYGYDHTVEFYKAEHRFPFYYESEAFCDKMLKDDSTVVACIE